MTERLSDLFPNTKHKLTTDKQLYRVLDELAEAEHELVVGDREKFLFEMLDTMTAAAGVLYKSNFNYSEAEISAGIAYVKAKNEARGYYSK